MSGTPQKKKHLLLSTLSSQSQQDGPIHDLVPSPTSQETWMASSGRLRIGPTGIPLKFQMGKVTQARSILREEASSTSASSSLPLSPHRLERGSESMVPPGSPTVGPGVGDGGGVGGAVGLDKLLTHQLHLLSTLVGPEVLKTLDVECVSFTQGGVQQERVCLWRGQPLHHQHPPSYLFSCTGTPHRTPLTPSPRHLHFPSFFFPVCAVTCFRAPWMPRWQP